MTLYLCRDKKEKVKKVIQKKVNKSVGGTTSSIKLDISL